MKPFNLEKFLAGEPAITRDGRKVIEHYYFRNSKNLQRLGYIIEGDFDILYSDDDGNFRDNGKSKFDLFMEEKEVDLYFNVYGDEKVGYSFSVYRKKEDAILWTNHVNFKGTHKITIKE